MTQPTALRLADDLAKYLGGNTATQAAAELRRLHAERTAADGVINDLAAKVRGLQTQSDALLEALKSTHAMLQATLFIMQDPEARSIAKAQLDKNRAAIKAAEENT